MAPLIFDFISCRSYYFFFEKIMRLIFCFFFLFFAFFMQSNAAWPVASQSYRYIDLSTWSYYVEAPEHYSVMLDILSATWGVAYLYDGPDIIGTSEYIDTSYIAHTELRIEGTGIYTIVVSLVPSSYDPGWDIVLTPDFVKTFYFWQSTSTVIVFFIVFVWKTIKRRR